MIDMKNAYLKVLGLADGQKPQEVQEGYEEQEAQYRKEAIKHAERILASVKNENLDGCKYLSRQLQDMADAMDSRIEDSEKYASAEMKEEVEEVDEAKQPHKFGDTWKSYDAIKKIFDRGFDKKDWTPDEVASVKKHVKIAGRKERGLYPGTGPMDFSAGAMHDHIVKYAKQPVKEEVEEIDEAIHSSQKDFAGERSHKDATNHARAMHRTLVSKGYNTRTINHLSSNDKDASVEYHHPDKPSKTMHIRHLNLGNKTQSSSVSLHSKTSANKLGEASVELDAETLEFVNKLSESGFDEYEIQSIIAKLSEAKSKKEEDEDDDTEQEFGDNMSDGEIEFANKHEVEVTDGTAKKMDHGKSVPKAVEPKATPVNQKPVVDYPNKDKPEVAVKSQASQPK